MKVFRRHDVRARILHTGGSYENEKLFRKKKKKKSIFKMKIQNIKQCWKGRVLIL